MPYPLMVIGAVTAPALAALLAALLAPRAAAHLSTAAAATILASGGILAIPTAHHHTINYGPLRADALTAWMLIAIGAVATIACWAGIQHLTPESPRAARRYLILVQLFLTCMALAVLADNLGVVWIAIEATTIVTAFLVGHRRTRACIEAAWKYVVLCSIGVAIALLGTICLYAASVAAAAPGITALDWSQLTTHAHRLDPDLTRLAAGLILLGFGTKAGLAPMHAWLPDAHSQAPAPVSALMSGVLLSVAFYAILRYRTIVDTALGPTYTRNLLFIAGLTSLAIAAALLIAQRDYKRLLAYSSIEHMGLITLGAAFGAPLALAGALLHILGHGLAKAAAFCGAGRIQQLTGDSRISSVRGLAAAQPALATTYGISLLALLGLPPFSLFASELGIARGGFTNGYGAIVAIAFALVLIAFTAITRHATAMLLGPAATAPVQVRSAVVPLATALAICAVLGLFLGPLQPLLDAAATIAGGHP